MVLGNKKDNTMQTLFPHALNGCYWDAQLAVIHRILGSVGELGRGKRFVSAFLKQRIYWPDPTLATEMDVYFNTLTQPITLCSLVFVKISLHEVWTVRGFVRRPFLFFKEASQIQRKLERSILSSENITIINNYDYSNDKSGFFERQTSQNLIWVETFFWELP